MTTHPIVPFIKAALTELSTHIGGVYVEADFEGKRAILKAHANSTHERHVYADTYFEETVLVCRLCAQGASCSCCFYFTQSSPEIMPCPPLRWLAYPFHLRPGYDPLWLPIEKASPVGRSQVAPSE